MAYVIPWINKASLALYIARITATRGWPSLASHTLEGCGLRVYIGLARARLMQQRDQPKLRKEYCVVEFVSVIEASKLVAIKVESRS